MSKVKYLTRKQKQVIEDLFTGKLDVENVLEKHRVRQRTYCRWHQQENFVAEYNRRLKLSQRRSELIFANWASSVAAKLVNLTDAEKEETARKACMDVINHPDRKDKNQSESKKPPVEEEPKPLPPEIATRLFAALAGEQEC
jgi:predicted DNA-binding protein YlxM (UPF0122 family)